MSDEQKSGRTRELVGVLLNGLSLGVLLLVVALGTATIIVPAVVGGMPLSILTGSMRPTYPPGTLVVITPTEVEDIAIGDVITFQLDSGQPTLVTHRVIERSVDSASGEVRFTTQGDANNTPDPEQVRPVQVRGTVWYAIPYLGWANQAIDGDTRSWAIPALAVALFAYATWTFGSGLRERVRKGREDRASAAAESGDSR